MAELLKQYQILPYGQRSHIYSSTVSSYTCIVFICQHAYKNTGKDIHAEFVHLWMFIVLYTLSMNQNFAVCHYMSLENKCAPRV